jgi:hypothetical protein
MIDMLFQPDTLATYEFRNTYKRISSYEPEETLMLAVLEEAIVCVQRYRGAKGKKENKLYRDAYFWIFEEEGNGAFSFTTICGAFDLDPDYLRMGLRKWQENNRANAPSTYLTNRGPRPTMQHWRAKIRIRNAVLVNRLRTLLLVR